MNVAQAADSTGLTHVDSTVSEEEEVEEPEEEEEEQDEEEQNKEEEQNEEEDGHQEQDESLASSSIVAFNTINRRRRSGGNCLYKAARKAIRKWKCRAPGSATRRRTAKYAYRPIPSRNPSTFETDCSGFIGWAIKFGPGSPCGQGLFREFQRKSGQVFAGPNRRRRNSKVYAKGYYIAITQESRRWVEIQEPRYIKPGDLVVYRIIGAGAGKDTGHIFIAMDTAHFVDAACPDNSGVKRYRLRIADSTKNTHYAPDTRISNGCRRFGGIGRGSIFLYAINNRLVGISNGFKANPRDSKCPPQDNVDSHQYAIGRITENS